MSRGFVKESDQEEPPMIPPRAALPDGVTNYVTPFGFEQLKQERKELENELHHVEAENETEKRRTISLLNGKLELLLERLNTARVIDPEDQPGDEVRFGAKVEIEDLDRSQRQNFQIVGVDEADIKEGKIAFVAPIAKAITGKKVDETAEFKLGNEVRKLKILNIEY